MLSQCTSYSFVGSHVNRTEPLSNDHKIIPSSKLTRSLGGSSEQIKANRFY